jgi:hypothetical protein
MFTQPTFPLEKSAAKSAQHRIQQTNCLAPMIIITTTTIGSRADSLPA